MCRGGQGRNRGRHAKPKPGFRPPLHLLERAERVEVGVYARVGLVDGELDLAVAEALERLAQALEPDLAAGHVDELDELVVGGARRAVPVDVGARRRIGEDLVHHEVRRPRGVAVQRHVEERVGVTEGGLIFGLTSFGVPQEVAFAAVMLYRLSTFYTPPVWGFFSLRWLERNRYL